ncbi:hypothetical protein C1H46_015618 [Malus baccata]|uniref:Myb/SANT-like domain-containing protein n=1 Tax=Malus baccata TaxID=106549 RepID=A0A540MJ38_MALBA|nr:hypothetical protein C1H46_015618 [Malus baccata]
MDHYDLHRQRRDLKHKARNVGRNVVWSLAMDKCLIDCLAIQARHGNKIDKSFNEHAYTAACIAVNSRFNLNLNNQKVINRLKTIKKSRWAKMKDGGHPSEMKNFEDDSASFLSPSSDDLSETDGTESYSGPEEEFTKLPDGSQDPPLIQPLRQLPKRPRGSEAVQDALMTVASSIRCLADAMEQSKYSIDASQLLQAVMEIDGLEEAKQMYAFEYLNADPVKARAFMTYDARMRKIYLFRQFWWWK